MLDVLMGKRSVCVRFDWLDLNGTWFEVTVMLCSPSYWEKAPARGQRQWLVHRRLGMVLANNLQSYPAPAQV